MASRTVEVDFDLDDFGTEELLQEVAKRGRASSLADLAALPGVARCCIKVLLTMECPDSIIRELEEWNNAPVADSLKLEKWKGLCGAGNGR